MNKVILASGVALLAACAQPSNTENDAEKQTMTYPDTRKGEVVDNYFGTDVPDPYRWLEDDLSEETGNWVASQNEVTDAYLEQIPYREALRARLEKLWNYEKVSAPFNRGNHTYFIKTMGCRIKAFSTVKKGKENPKSSWIPINSLQTEPHPWRA
jgi:prolyl oligopeptidase